jgi:type IV pilus assembly protein PilN
MIKINLLPVRAAKKKENDIQQITIFCVSLLLVAVVVTAMYTFKRIQINATKNEITVANSRINELKAKIGKLEELKALKEQVKKKLDVLAQLRKNKTGPAHRLATLSDNTPDQLWLTGYSENGNDVKIAGLAFTEELIATFMRSIEASADFMGVELVVTEQAESGGAKLKRFELVCKLRTAPEQAKQQAPNAPK